MSNRETALYFLDIFIAYDKINRYTKKFNNAQDFLHSELEWDATIRELEIIGEATNHLLTLNVINIKHRRIVDFRNQIIHGYFGIDEDIVFEVIRNKLVLYITDLKTSNINLSKAIQLAKLEHSNNKNILLLLNNLEEDR
ncbi:MAG: HepT-like ribonuclease domain-containing protein [Campylobacterota bacterium]|nr:HepT-like ribonuclease domain-containing protein [Campylobacterota bacterium]